LTPSAVPACALPRALVAVATLAFCIAADAAAASPPAGKVERARERLAQRLGPGAVIRADRRTGTLRSLGRLDGPLTGPSGRAADAIALDFVRANATAFGLSGADTGTLRLADRIHNADGFQYLTWGQQVAGVPAAGATLRATVDRDGRLRALAGTLLADLGLDETKPAITAADAYRRVRGGAPAVARRGAGPERTTSFRDGGSASLVASRQDGRDRLAWRVLAPIDSQRYDDAIVDAATGAVWRRFNRVRNEGRIAHFTHHPGASVGGEQTTEQAPAGWLATAAPGSPLVGPNAHAVLDPEDAVWVAESAAPPFYVEPDVNDADEAPADSGGDWLSTLQIAPDGSTWDAGTPHSWLDNAGQSAAQLFWFVNRFHDHLAAAPIGFDAASGAFQGDDPIIAQAMDGANGPGGAPDADHLNNANMLTLPDGAHGYMQMYLFGGGLPEVDGANDASLVYHEYTHGLSGRLVTYADGWDAMWAAPDGGQPGALGEGTSDWYAMDYLVAQGLEIDAAGAGDVRVGEYVDGGTDAIRFQGVDCPVGAAACAGTPTSGDGGFDFSDYGVVWFEPEVHADGEIWAQTLWDLRSALVAAQPDGLERVRRYVTGGLRLAPPEPTFLEMRDAILQAAAATGGELDLDLLWQAFAARGMGWSAATTGPLDTTPAAAFDRPPGAETGDASAIQPTSATLEGVVDPKGSATSYRFEYGETQSYEAMTATTAAGAGGAVAVAQGITGLRPGTTYHYRVVAVRGDRLLAGLDRSFATAPAPVVAVPPVITPPVQASPAVSIPGSRLRANRKGRFMVKVAFAATAPEGTARLTVLMRGKRIAGAKLGAQPGRTVTVKLRLSKSGRRMIRPGRSRRVKLEVTLPGGGKVAKLVRLTRRR
jgi:extracellular elastinolytic metalloproteinase